VKFIVDADVLSEPTKPAPSERVLEWLRANESELAVSPIVLGEIEFGIRALPAGKRRARLERWFVAGAPRLRTLDFTFETSTTWAKLLVRLRKKGASMPIKDSLIAATALTHDLTMATRNVADYRRSGVRLVNPFA
jgi:predicted nucleic acid-binding protein